MKKLVPIMAGVLVVLAVILLYTLSFPVKADNSNLEDQARRFLSRGQTVALKEPIEIYDALSIGNQKFVLVEIGDELGEITLVRGLAGGYKIQSAGYGMGNFWEKVVEIGGQKYFLIGGRNSWLTLGSIEVKFSGLEYTVAIPEKERFFVYTEIDQNTEDTHADQDAMRFYNRGGEDFTEQIQWY